MAAVNLPEFPEKSRFGMPNLPEFPAPPIRGAGVRERDRVGHISRTFGAMTHD